MYIVVDFDGTCVTHEFPKVGKDIGAVPVLKALTENGHKILLNTMRSNKEQEPNGKSVLQDAVDWFSQNEISLYGINENPDQKSWTTSPKVYGNVYIDDAALGCPLIFQGHLSSKPYVNWAYITKWLCTHDIISREQYDNILKSIRLVRINSFK